MRTTIAALAVVATASLALAQNADKNTAGPTKNDYRLKIVEPKEGATVDGGTVRVVVDTRIPAEIGTEKRDVNSMPRPIVDVFLDNTNKGSLKAEQNVLEVDGVNAGAHKIVLVAKNLSGEVIDRQEVNFTASTSTASSTTSTRSTAAGATSTDTSSTGTDTSADRKMVGTATGSSTPGSGSWNAPKDNDQAMNQSTSSTSGSTSSAPQSSSSTYSGNQSSTSSSSPSSTSSMQTTSPSTTGSTTSRSTSTMARNNTLPRTATSDPLVAGAGLALLIGGYALRRRQA